MDFGRMKISLEYDKHFQSTKWIDEIPYLNFPNDVEVKVIPPFAGAVVRFVVRKGKNTVSVYLDCYNILGIFNEPYWEIYPYYEDVYRCPMNETDDLMEKIEEALDVLEERSVAE
jgi:hypothetical protein